jgi:hypothetical protein
MSTRPKLITTTLLTPALDNVCADQTTGGAANLLIDGTLASGGVVALTTAHRLDFESAGDINTIIFTITGTDPDGAAQTNTVTGVNASTVTSTAYFKTITQIAASGEVDTNVSVGTTDEFATATFPLDPNGNLVGAYLGIDIGGTANVTAQECVTNVFDPAIVKNWVAIAALAAKTADTNAALSGPARAVRLIGNTYSANATATMAVSQG